MYIADWNLFFCMLLDIIDKTKCEKYKDIRKLICVIILLKLQRNYN